MLLMLIIVAGGIIAAVGTFTVDVGGGVGGCVVSRGLVPLLLKP